jgi:hypothetical protein
MYRMNLDEQLDGGEYMTLKRQKLAESNKEMLQDSDIFRGLVFYVNGATEPPQNELREMLVKNGGEFQYHHSGRVTHVVAEQLSGTKTLKLGPSHHVVRPAWILDSIAKGTRLPTTKYEMDRGGDKLFADKR